MSATEAQSKTAITDTVKWYDILRIVATKSAGAGGFANGTITLTDVAYASLTSQQDTCVADYIYSDWSDKEGQALEASRQVVASALNSAPNLYRWLLRDYGKSLGFTETDSSKIFDRLYDYYVTNGYVVYSRGFNFGTITAGSGNYGNGVVYRLNTDAAGYTIENQCADTKYSKCLTDANNGAAKWEEVFEIRGTPAEKDNLSIVGSGKVGRVTATSARQSANLVANPSWSQTTPAGPSTALTAITNWTSDVTVSTTYYDSIGGTGANGYYRGSVGDTTPLALRIKGNVVLSQNLETRRSKFDYNTPYLVQIAWRRKASATGNLILRLGNQSVTATIGSGTNDQWNILRFTGTQCWFKNFDKAGLTVSVETTSLATSNVDVDDLLIVPMTQFDGSWYAYTGTPATGDPLQWLVNDSFSWTDTEHADGAFHGVIQRMFCWRGFGRYLPARNYFFDIADTLGVALAGAGAGNVDNGTHGYAYTYVDGNSVESMLGDTAIVTVTDKTTNGKVSVTGVSAGPTGTVSRKIYRTVAAGSIYKLLTTLSDNVTTTYTDNTADASLGATIPYAFSGASGLVDPYS